MAAERASGFINKRLETDRGWRRYVVYVPHDYTEDRIWPLIVFLHGKGERGDDGLQQTEVGLGRALRMWPDRFPSLVVMPQCPGEVMWDEAFDDIDGSFSQTLKEYRVDRSRVYLTGISMGGYATWIYGAQHSDRFAALVPICGGGRTEDAAVLKGIPIWAFHGADDDRVPVSESRTMVDALKRARGSIRYTEHKNVGHHSWDVSYGNAKVAQWLFKQSKH